MCKTYYKIRFNAYIDSTTHYPALLLHSPIIGEDIVLLKCLGLVIIILLSGCRQFGGEWQKASSSPVKQGSTVQIRVVNATNNRLQRMSSAQLRIMLASAQAAVKTNFGVNIEFTDVTETGIEQVFAIIPPPLREIRKSSIYDFKAGTGDKQKLSKGINTTLTERGTKLEDGLAFVKPYIPRAQAKDLMSFSELLSNVMLERLEKWRSVKAEDGLPVLDDTPYNEITYWDIMGYGNLPYELVITNQLFASAEYDGVDIHTAIRGGITVGLTTYSRESKFGTYIVFSTFPFLDNSESTQLLRGGETYSEVEAAELSGAYLTHEIGHMLFQFGHPFGQNSCVMNPASMLQFREWFNQLDSASCLIGSRAEMTPGAVPEYHNVNWLRMSR